MHVLGVDRSALAALLGRGSRLGRRGVATRLVLRVVAAIGEELRIRRDMRQLTGMSEHMLRDIGLTRADIADAVRHGRD